MTTHRNSGVKFKKQLFLNSAKYMNFKQYFMQTSFHPKENTHMNIYVLVSRNNILKINLYLENKVVCQNSAEILKNNACFKNAIYLKQQQKKKQQIVLVYALVGTEETYKTHSLCGTKLKVIEKIKKVFHRRNKSVSSKTLFK